VSFLVGTDLLGAPDSNAPGGDPGIRKFATSRCVRSDFPGGGDTTPANTPAFHPGLEAESARPVAMTRTARCSGRSVPPFVLPAESENRTRWFFPNDTLAYRGRFSMCCGLPVVAGQKLGLATPHGMRFVINETMARPYWKDIASLRQAIITGLTGRDVGVLITKDVYRPDSRQNAPTPFFTSRFTGNTILRLRFQHG